MHETAGKTLPCQNIFIALPLPARLAVCSAFSSPTAAARQPPLLPFHTVITHLYIAGRAARSREARQEDRDLLLSSSCDPRIVQRTCAHVLSRPRVLHARSQGRIFILANRSLRVASEKRAIDKAINEADESVALDDRSLPVISCLRGKRQEESAVFSVDRLSKWRRNDVKSQSVDKLVIIRQTRGLFLEMRKKSIVQKRRKRGKTRKQSQHFCEISQDQASRSFALRPERRIASHLHINPFYQFARHGVVI